MCVHILHIFFAFNYSTVIFLILSITAPLTLPTTPKVTSGIIKHTFVPFDDPAFQTELLNSDYIFSQIIEFTLSTHLKICIYTETEQNIHATGTLPMPFGKGWINFSEVIKLELIGGKTDSGMSKNISLRNQL